MPGARTASVLLTYPSPDCGQQLLATYLSLLLLRCFARRQRESCQAAKLQAKQTLQILRAAPLPKARTAPVVPTLLILATFVGRGQASTASG